MERYAIIGFGCAGYNALSAMREAGFDGEIHVYSEWGDPPASPMLTTYYVSGLLQKEGLYPFGSLEEIAKRFDCVIHSNTRVTALNPVTKTVTLDNGTCERFDKILISTGATPITPDLGVKNSTRIFYMRSVKDAELLKATLETGTVSSAVVIGGSMVGIKVTELLWKRGIHVMLADMAPHIFSATAFEDVAIEVERRVKAKGVSMSFGSGIRSAQETEESILTFLDNGKVLESDILILCIGTRGRVDLVQVSDIQVNCAIVIKPDMQTSVPGIYAAGDCTEGENMLSHQTTIIGLWANAGYQGETAGRSMAGQSASYTGNIPHNLTHFMGMDFISFGDVRAQGETRRFGNPQDKTYIQVTLAEGKIVCVNILDEYRVSGIIRNYMLNVLSGANEPMPPALKGYLAACEMEKEFLNLFQIAGETDGEGESYCG